MTDDKDANTGPIDTARAVIEAKRRDVRRVIMAFTALLALVFMLGGFWIYDLSTARDYWRSTAIELQQQNDDKDTAYRDLYDEYVTDTGRLPSADDPSKVSEAPPPEDDPPAAMIPQKGDTGDTGPRGEQGPPPSDEQVLASVETFCVGTGHCTGTPGKDGAKGDKGDPGQDATDEQVAAAQAAWCEAHNQCRGADGRDGKDGADSTVPGPPGPTCPDGTTITEIDVRIQGDDTWQTILACTIPPKETP